MGLADDRRARIEPEKTLMADRPRCYLTDVFGETNGGKETTLYLWKG